MLEWIVSRTAYRSLLQLTYAPEAVVDYIVHLEVHLLGILCVCGHPKVVDEEESRKSKIEVISGSTDDVTKGLAGAKPDQVRQVCSSHINILVQEFVIRGLCGMTWISGFWLFRNIYFHDRIAPLSSTDLSIENTQIEYHMPSHPI